MQDHAVLLLLWIGMGGAHEGLTDPSSSTRAPFGILFSLFGWRDPNVRL